MKAKIESIEFGECTSKKICLISAIVSAAVVLIIVLSVVGMIIWAAVPMAPDAEALAALESDETIKVVVDDFVSFLPLLDTEPRAGLIIYPGARVAAEAYAPVARAIALNNYVVVVVPMPINFAIFGSDKAQQVIERYPKIAVWAMAGHSMGGAAACQYIHNEDKNKFVALYLWAAYASSASDLSTHPLEVISLYGSNDEVLSVDMPETLKYLPTSTHLVEIVGGNHAYFGNYGMQDGDGEATISRHAQQNITVSYVVQSLNNLTDSSPSVPIDI